MTEADLARRVAREPQPIQVIYRGLKAIVAGAGMLDLADGSPVAEFRDDCARAVAEFERALEFEAGTAAAPLSHAGWHPGRGTCRRCGGLLLNESQTQRELCRDHIDQAGIGETAEDG